MRPVVALIAMLIGAATGYMVAVVEPVGGALAGAGVAGTIYYAYDRIVANEKEKEE